SPKEGEGKKEQSPRVAVPPQDTTQGGHCEPRIFVWRGNPEFLTQCDLLFKMREGDVPPPSSLLPFSKSVVGNPKVFTEGSFFSLDGF
ncbi:MAG TPA: hypothetical protein PKU94_09020, partial [Candidatus Hydrothermia bacterium]|nr:hypothetical protein [Candidatus Hydrothermia bacterium]